MADTSLHWRIVPTAFMCHCGHSGDRWSRRDRSRPGKERWTVILRVGLINCYNHYNMKLTEAQRVQIFCSALNAHIQADATAKAASGSNIGSGMGVLSAVERASSTAAEAI